MGGTQRCERGVPSGVYLGVTTGKKPKPWLDQKKDLGKEGGDGGGPKEVLENTLGGNVWAKKKKIGSSTKEDKEKIKRSQAEGK